MSVYKLVSKQTPKIYIGSTSCSLKRRLITHKGTFNKYLTNSKQRCYCSSYQLLRFHDCKIELIEEVKDPSQLRIREDHHIMLNRDCAVNQRRAIKNENYHLEYYKKNRARQIQTSLAYYYRNHEARLAYQLSYNRKNREKHREYMRQYVKTPHRIQWAKDYAQKQIGECKICERVYKNISNHLKSQKHKKNVAKHKSQSEVNNSQSESKTEELLEPSPKKHEKGKEIHDTEQ